MRAIVESDLPPYLRHFLHVLAFLARSSTGVAWHSQQTIAKAMGVSERQVRRYFGELERHGGPVRVERRRRAARDGKGRGSDEWRLILQPDIHGTPTGHPRPLDDADQPDIHGTPTGHPRHSNRTPTSGERRRNEVENGDPSVSLRSTGEGPTLSLPFAADAAGDPEGAKAPKPSGRSSKAKAAKEPSAEAHQLKIHYVAEFARTRGCEPDLGRQWPRAMKAFAELAALKGGLEGAKAIITRALSDEYTRQIMPWEILRDAPKYQGKAPRKANGRAPHVQHGLAPGVIIPGYND